MSDIGFPRRQGTCNTFRLCFALVAVTACQEQPTDPEPPVFVPVPTAIEVTPTTAVLTSPGSIEQLTAVVRDQTGNAIENATVEWSSANPEIATVNSTGLVTGQDEGGTRISARHDTLVASAAVLVLGDPVPTWIIIQPGPDYLILPPPDGVVQLTAYVLDQYDSQMEDAIVQWSSANPEVAAVGTMGFVTAQSEGSTRISAQLDTLVATLEIIVGDDPERQALTRFYEATGGPNWDVSTNWLSRQPLFMWEGIRTGDNGRVTQIRLPSNGLAGEIPSTIGELSGLIGLALTDNALTGGIPSSIRDLKQLGELALGDNELTGPLPAEIGEASQLVYIEVSGNSLTGLLPEGMIQLRAGVFEYNGTELCAPRSTAFQQWLEGVSLVFAQPCSASRHDRLVLTELYEATGGSAWTRKDGWLTDAALDEWAGVSVDDSGRVTALDLMDNNVAGKLPYQLTYLRELTGLDVSENEELHGVLQEWMTKLDLATLHIAETGLCAPPREGISKWLDEMSAWSGEECEGAGSILANVPVVYLTRTVQNQDAGVPLIAGRDAFLRVFAVADSVNYFDSEIRATFYRDGEEVHVADMTVEGRHGIALEVDESRLETSHNSVIPGEVLVPGLEMVVEVDPDGKLPLREGSQRRIPESGTLALDVRELPGFKMTIVPIQVEGEDTTLAAGASRMTLQSQAVADLLKTQPIADFDFSVRETLYTSGTTIDHLLAVDLLRQVDGDPGYYVGIIAGGGVAYLGGRASLSDTTGATLAHEIGHNLSLLHAPCGRTNNNDLDFPHEGGRTGAWGRDPRTGKLWSPGTPDLMSYCTRYSYWISDYSHTRALEFRVGQGAEVSARLAADRRKTSSLVLWGRAGPDEVVLDPAIVVDALPSLPNGGGRYRIEGRSARGATLFSLRFNPTIEAESGEGHFLFTLPVEAAWTGSLATITLTGPNGSDRLDATVRRPIAIVTDRVTGRIRKLLRDFETAPVAGPGEVVTVSRGLPDEAALRGRR